MGLELGATCQIVDLRVFLGSGITHGPVRASMRDDLAGPLPDHPVAELIKLNSGPGANV